MLDLRVEQIRPLMFAVMRNFEPAETKTAFRMFLSWSVRFLIAGGGRGGMLDRSYSGLAKSVTAGQINKSSGLFKDMITTVPTDAEFEAAFKVARVSQTFLARYYLRALEMTKKGESDPETVPNVDDAINLEHIMPETISDEWDIDTDVAEAYCRRLGNMVLLKAKTNVAIGNSSFAAKRPTYKASAYMLTKEVASKTKWGPTRSPSARLSSQSSLLGRGLRSLQPEGRTLRARCACPGSAARRPVDVKARRTVASGRACAFGNSA